MKNEEQMSMKVNFYYVRHGQTLFNRLGRMQGMCDSPLTEKGVEDAEEIASVLRQVSFQHAYTSSSERALDTAKIICQYHDVTLIDKKGLKEFDFGDLDGQPMDAFKSRIWGDAMRDDWREYHGESTEIFDQRTRKAFSEILEDCNDNDNVLIVSHGSFIMHLMKTLLNFDQHAYVERRNAEGKPWMPNCGICVFTYEDGKWAMQEEPVSAEEFREKHFPKTVSYYLVRHGETHFNVLHRLQGQCDSPLTENGIAQAKQTCEKLKDVTFDLAFSSTSERARDTADIILSNRDMHAYTDERLKETFFGDLEGSDYQENFSEQRERFVEVHYKDIGGEDKEDVQKRIVSFLRDTTDQAVDGDNVLLVTHANYYTVLLETLFGIDRKKLFHEAHEKGINPTPNGGICRFQYHNGTWSLLEMMNGEKYE